MIFMGDMVSRNKFNMVLAKEIKPKLPAGTIKPASCHALMPTAIQIPDL